MNGVNLPSVEGLGDLYFCAEKLLLHRLTVLPFEEFKRRCEHLVTQKCIDTVKFIDSDSFCIIGYSYIFDWFIRWTSGIDICLGYEEIIRNNIEHSLSYVGHSLMEVNHVLER